MKLPRRQVLQLAASAAALPVVSRIARAQTYPSRPLTMIVPYPAGGPTDTIARVLGERMRASLGQPIIIENVAGAGGNIGVGRVARAAGDGYTLGIGHWGSHVVNGAIYTLPYDLLTDLEPVALLSDGPQLIVAARSVPAKDIKELIAWLKANPGKAMVGTTGVGGASHLAGILFQNTTIPTFRSCRIAALRRACRTCSRARSIWHSTKRRIHCRKCEAATSRLQRTVNYVARVPLSPRNRGALGPGWATVNPGPGSALPSTAQVPP
jgi:Tripartite tricarboxylate transporter family receptor